MNRTLRYLQATADTGVLDIPDLVDHIIEDAVLTQASDIHIEPWESMIVVRMRLNGVLSEVVHLPLELQEKIAGRFKVMANLVTYQTELPQEGHAQARTSQGAVELRISLFPTVRGEKIVVRIFDPRNRSFDLADLGFDADVLVSLKQLLARPGGLLLLTGPTGSGKTTAMYAALCQIVQRAGPAMSVSTVEDPVEYSLPMVSQAQINPVKEFTYPRALRSLMRQDPQVIMIGEIRDPETASIAVQAGLTGHLVISTIHSGSTAGVFARLINMELEPFLLASSIIGVLGLRLIRRTCSACALPCDPDPVLVRLLPPGTPVGDRLVRGSGCAECLHTGYAGRTSLSELLLVDDVLREAVLRKLPTGELQEVAVRQGMRTLLQTGLGRVLSGQTTVDEVLRVVAADF